MRYWARRLLLFVMALLVTALVGLYVRLAQRPYFSDPAGTVLIVTTDYVPSTFADQIVQGAKAAQTTLEKEGRAAVSFETLHLSVDGIPGSSDETSVPDQQWRIRRRLMERLGRGGVTGIISTGASSVDREVAEVAATLRVPLIVTGATDDDVIPKDRLTTVVRMIPPNDLQADAAVAWMADKGLVAVLYEPSSYGKQIATRIAVKAAERGTDILPFPIASLDDYVQLGNLNARYNFKSFVLIAYPPRLQQLVAAVSRVAPDAPVLLSDVGVAGFGNSRKNVYALLAIDVPVARTSDMSGFQPLGHDAYMLLANLSSAHGSSVVERFDNTMESQRDDILMPQLFAEDGERRASHYVTCRMEKDQCLTN